MSEVCRCDSCTLKRVLRDLREVEDRLKAEIGRLREALKPFARVAAGVPDELPDAWRVAVGTTRDVATYEPPAPGSPVPTAGDYRRAAEVLKGDDR